MITTEHLQRKGSKYGFIRASRGKDEETLCIGNVAPVLEVHWQAARLLADALGLGEVAPVGHHTDRIAYFEPWAPLSSSGWPSTTITPGTHLAALTSDTLERVLDAEYGIAMSEPEFPPPPTPDQLKYTTT